MGLERQRKLKNRCAKEALSLIEGGMIVGLGGGGTVQCLVELIAEKGLDIQVVSPSFQTASHCVARGLIVVPTWSVDNVDIAFDGCDEVDMHLNALKSGGAIHTKEKIIASMAKRYVLLVDGSKVFERLPFAHSVTIEIVPESLGYVRKALAKLGADVSMRTSAAKDGYTMSDHGNMIMEAKFDGVEDPKRLNRQLCGITGIVDTSLFVGKVDLVLCVDENGTRWIQEEVK